MHGRGLRGDESYWAVLVSGGGDGPGSAAAAGAGGAGAAFAGGDAAGAAAAGDFSRSAGSRLTFDTVVAGGPIGPATWLPTLILSASGLPVLSTGAVAFDGTV